MAVVYSIVEISWRIFSTTTVISEFDVLLYIFYYSIYLIIPIAAISGVFFLDLSIRIFKEMKTNKGKQSRE
jgi:heme O synthase-like polyprenyltransferase